MRCKLSKRATALLLLTSATCLLLGAVQAHKSIDDEEKEIAAAAAAEANVDASQGFQDADGQILSDLDRIAQ